MKRLNFFAFTMIVACFASPLGAQVSKPIYVSLPGPGNIQHLAYVVAKEKKFYDEMGLSNVNIVVLRGNAMNVQALLSGSVHYSSAFGPSMQAMFKGEQIRVLLQIFNQIPFGLITRPEIKRLEDLKGQKIAVTFGGSTYSVLQALFAKYGYGEKFADALHASGRTLLLCGAPPQPAHLMAQAEFHRHVGAANILPNVEAALIRAAELRRAIA